MKSKFDIGNVILIIVVLLIFSISTIIYYNVGSEINTELLSDNDFSDIAKNSSNQTVKVFENNFDNGFIFIFGIFLLFLMVSALLSSQHPILFIVAVLFMIILIIVGAYLSNVYEEIENDSDLSVSASQFPKMSFIMNNIPYVVLALIFLTGIMLFIGRRYFA